MKVALCFIISYNQKLNKEHIWKQWIEENKDIINVYFHYTHYNSIQSQWIKDHCIPEKNIVKTSYYDVVPAYLSLMKYAFDIDKENQWFCFLTESCIPILSPQKFKALFLDNYEKSIIQCEKANWNVDFHKKANLRLLKQDYHMKNEPWFTLKREDIKRCIFFLINNKKLFHIICNGGLANESIFAIILKVFGQLDNIKNEKTHIIDWTRRQTPTSPYLFKYGTIIDYKFIIHELNKNKYAMFLRKVSPELPDQFIYHFLDK